MRHCHDAQINQFYYQERKAKYTSATKPAQPDLKGWWMSGISALLASDCTGIWLFVIALFECNKKKGCDNIFPSHFMFLVGLGRATRSLQ